MNTIKLTCITSEDGRPLGVGHVRPGRMHDQTAIKTEGIDQLLTNHPHVQLIVDDGYRGLARDHPDQVTCPPRKPNKDAFDFVHQAWHTARTAHSSTRICVEHGIAELKAFRPLQHWLGHRLHLGETALAITGLISDRTRTA